MPDEQEEIKLHPRLSGVDFSEKMVIGLLKKDTMGRDTWLVAALRQRYLAVCAYLQSCAVAALLWLTTRWCSCIEYK